MAEYVVEEPSNQSASWRVHERIVRCKNCKHRHLDGMIWDCPFGHSGGEDFFCAYGAKDGDSDSAQPLIRCRDCKHHHYQNDIPYCDRIDYGYGWKADDFCSHAERRTDG